MAMSMTMSMCNKLTVADSNSSIRRVDLRSNHLPIETERLCQFCKRFRSHYFRLTLHNCSPGDKSSNKCLLWHFVQANNASIVHL